LLGVSALQVVAVLANFPTHSVPHLMQVWYAPVFSVRAMTCAW
jgi:hypothetical protein